MSAAPTYEIRAIADFGMVPTKRLNACLKEFCAAMRAAREVSALLEASEKVLYPGLTEPIEWTTPVFKWTDERRAPRKLTVRITPPIAYDGAAPDPEGTAPA